LCDQSGELLGVDATTEPVFVRGMDESGVLLKHAAEITIGWSLCVAAPHRPEGLGLVERIVELAHLLRGNLTVVDLETRTAVISQFVGEPA